MAKIVLYTFAIFNEPNEHEPNVGLHERYSSLRPVLGRVNNLI